MEHAAGAPVLRNRLSTAGFHQQQGALLPQEGTCPGRLALHCGTAVTFSLLTKISYTPSPQHWISRRLELVGSNSCKGMAFAFNL